MTPLEISLLVALWVSVAVGLWIAGAMAPSWGGGEDRASLAVCLLWPVALVLIAVVLYGRLGAWVLTRRGPLHGFHHRLFDCTARDPVHHALRRGRESWGLTVWQCEVCRAPIDIRLGRRAWEESERGYEGVGAIRVAGEPGWSPPPPWSTRSTY